MAGSIYIFTNSYKPSLGGIQTVASQLAETLSARGEKVIVVAQLTGKAFLPFSHICSVPVWRFRFEWKISLFFLWILFKFRKPEKVYVHFPEIEVPAVLWLKKHFDFRLITCFHGHDVLRYDEGYSRSSFCYRAQFELVQTSDKVSACSRYMASAVERIFNCSGVVPVYNGIDLKRFATPPCSSPWPRPYIFAMGRLEKVKGFDMLVEAYSKIDSRKEYDLLIAGSGSQRDCLAKQIDNLGLSDKVFLIGRKTPEEIVRFAGNSEMTVIPSLRESFGIVVLEAIAAGRPVVATKAGGVAEIMDERFGVLVSPDVKGIQSGMETVLRDLSAFDFSSSKEYLERFSIDTMVNNYANL